MKNKPPKTNKKSVVLPKITYKQVEKANPEQVTDDIFNYLFSKLIETIQ